MTDLSLSIETQFTQRLEDSRFVHHCDNDKVSQLMSLSRTQFKKVFAEIVNTAHIKPFNITPVSIIHVTNLPDVSELRKEHEPILCGVRQPVTLNLFSLLKTAWSHEEQDGSLLKYLIPSWNQNDNDTKVKVEPDEPIHGHYGFTVLKWIEQNWKLIPRVIRRELQDKKLYGWADISTGKCGTVVPILGMHQWSTSSSPVVGWYFLRNLNMQTKDCRKNCFGIRE